MVEDKCRFDFYNPKWEAKIRGFELKETQKNFVFAPSKALDFFKLDGTCFAVIIFAEEEPIGFFVLDRRTALKDNIKNKQSIILRSFSIDRHYQGCGYAGAAMKILPGFVHNHFLEVEEILLTVHEKNVPAKKLYEKSGFVYNGEFKMGPNGIEQVMIYSFQSKTGYIM
ncbi:GNAT family N-acetyltransferase [Escherichia coli]|nr:GNAT family N-acetyltransferase [Escherichia coli]